MSLEHSSVTPNPLEALSELLKAKPGDDVIVQSKQQLPWHQT